MCSSGTVQRGVERGPYQPVVNLELRRDSSVDIEAGKGEVLLESGERDQALSPEALLDEHLRINHIRVDERRAGEAIDRKVRVLVVADDEGRESHQPGGHRRGTRAGDERDGSGIARHRPDQATCPPDQPHRFLELRLPKLFPIGRKAVPRSRNSANVIPSSRAVIRTSEPACSNAAASGSKYCTCGGLSISTHRRTANHRTISWAPARRRRSARRPARPRAAAAPAGGRRPLAEQRRDLGDPLRRRARAACWCRARR